MSDQAGLIESTTADPLMFLYTCLSKVVYRRYGRHNLFFTQSTCQVLSSTCNPLQDIVLGYLH